jgi:hypothetical protein
MSATKGCSPPGLMSYIGNAGERQLVICSSDGRWLPPAYFATLSQQHDPMTRGGNATKSQSVRRGRRRRGGKTHWDEIQQLQQSAAQKLPAVPTAPPNPPKSLTPLVKYQRKVKPVAKSHFNPSFTPALHPLRTHHYPLFQTVYRPQRFIRNPVWVDADWPTVTYEPTLDWQFPQPYEMSSEPYPYATLTTKSKTRMSRSKSRSRSKKSRSKKRSKSRSRSKSYSYSRFWSRSNS